MAEKSIRVLLYVFKSLWSTILCKSIMEVIIKCKLVKVLLHVFAILHICNTVAMLKYYIRTKVLTLSVTTPWNAYQLTWQEIIYFVQGHNIFSHIIKAIEWPSSFFWFHTEWVESSSHRECKYSIRDLDLSWVEFECNCDEYGERAGHVDVLCIFYWMPIFCLLIPYWMV